MKNLAVPLTVFLVCIFTLAAETEAQSKNGSIFQMGAILPLSGAAALVGRAMQAGIELALDERPECGIRLVYEDDKTADSSAAVTAVHKLIDVDRVSVLLNSVVNTSRAIAPIVARRKVPTLILWDSNRTIHSLSPWIYGFGISTEAGGELSAQYAAAHLKSKTAAVLSLEDEWSEIISSAFKQKFIELGGDIVAEERFTIDETDFRSTLLKIRRLKPDLIYFALFGSPRAAFIAQIKTIDASETLFTADIFPDEQEVLGLMLEGVYSTQTVLESQELVQKYKLRLGKTALNTTLGLVALGYDAFNFVCQTKLALESMGIYADSETMQSYLSRAAFSGLLSSVDFSTSRESTAKPRLLIVKDGEFQALPGLPGNS